MAAAWLGYGWIEGWLHFPSHLPIRLSLRLPALTTALAFSLLVGLLWRWSRSWGRRFFILLTAALLAYAVGGASLSQWAPLTWSEGLGLAWGLALNSPLAMLAGLTWALVWGHLCLPHLKPVEPPPAMFVREIQQAEDWQGSTR